MIRYSLLLLLLVSFALNGKAEFPIKAADKGEHLKYVIHYGIIRGGKASLKLKNYKIKWRRSLSRNFNR